MNNRNVLAIGTSAGGVESLISMAKRLPPDLPAAILVTIHLSAEYRSSLDELLSDAGPLPASFVEDGEPLRCGHIYLAKPDYHLLLIEEHLYRGTGPRENNARPAIDPMFRSVAQCCGYRAVGALLTGNMSDGVSGLQALQGSGARIVIQDPSDAAFPHLPTQALHIMTPDRVVSLTDLPEVLTDFVHQPATTPKPVADRLRYEIDVARGAPATTEATEKLGQRSLFTCPECNGLLWEINEGNVIRYRCHIGHAYSEDVFGVALDNELRRAMSTALRALEERHALITRMAAQAHQHGHTLIAATWHSKAIELQHEIGIVRRSLKHIEEIATNSIDASSDEEKTAKSG